MNEIVNKFLLVGDKFMPEMHLKNLVLLIVLVVHSDFIYKNKLDKACFQLDMAYGKTKYLVKRTQSDKVLKDKAFQIASDPKYNGYQRGLVAMVYKIFDKKSKGSGIANEPNYQLANELRKPIIRKF